MRTLKPRFLKNLQKTKEGQISLYSEDLPLSGGLCRILETLATIEENESVQIFKQGFRKCVISVQLPEKSGGDFVIKGFPLERIKDQLRPSRFGISEGRNLVNAHRLGIRTPKFLGYAESRFLGLTRMNCVIMESLNNFHTIMEMLEQDPSQTSLILNRAIPIIDQLYQTGVNHIDISPHNILIKDSDCVLIDWQNCQFIEAKNDRQLVLQTAQFLRYLQDSVSEQDQQDWISSVFEIVSPKLSKASFLKTVLHYSRIKKLSKSLRYSMDFNLDQTSP